MCNRKCLWNYENSCVSERFEEIYKDDTYETDKCIGFLREDMFDHMIELKSEMLAYLNDDEHKDIIKEIKNMSYKDTLRLHKAITGVE